jgi:hypothetical protein
MLSGYLEVKKCCRNIKVVIKRVVSRFILNNFLFSACLFILAQININLNTVDLGYNVIEGM